MARLVINNESYGLISAYLLPHQMHNLYLENDSDLILDDGKWLSLPYTKSCQLCGDYVEDGLSVCTVFELNKKKGWPLKLCAVCNWRALVLYKNYPLAQVPRSVRKMI